MAFGLILLWIGFDIGNVNILVRFEFVYIFDDQTGSSQCFQKTNGGMVLKVMLIFTLLLCCSPLPFLLFEPHFVLLSLQNLSLSIGCPPGIQLVFDVSTTLQQSVM